MRWRFIVWCAFASVLAGQTVESYFRDLVSTPDGSALYFTTGLTPTGSGLRAGSRIYRVTDLGVQLVVDLAATNLASTDPWREMSGIVGPMLNGQGHLSGWSTYYYCQGGLSFICSYQISVRSTVQIQGQLYGERVSQFVMPTVSSPEHRFILRQEYQGLGASKILIMQVGRPDVSRGCAEGYGLGIYAVSDGGDCFVYEGQTGKVAVVTFDGIRYQPGIESPVRKISAIPGGRSAYVLQDVNSRYATSLSRVSIEGDSVRRETLLESPGLSCSDVQASRGGGAVLRCFDERPFWRWDGNVLAPIALQTTNVLAWTLALDGDVIWYVDGSHRIRRYRISTGEDEARFGPHLSVQMLGQTYPGAWTEILGTGFERERLPEVTWNGTRLDVQFRSEMVLLARVPESYVPRQRVVLRVNKKATSQIFDTPIELEIGFSALEWTAFSNPRYLGGPYKIPLIILQDFQEEISPTRPARPGEIVHLYASGSKIGDLSCRLNQTDLAVTYAGPAPGLPGVDQVSIYLPLDLGDGLYSLVCWSAPIQQRINGVLPVLLQRGVE